VTGAARIAGATRPPAGDEVVVVAVVALSKAVATDATAIVTTDEVCEIVGLAGASPLSPVSLAEATLDSTTSWWTIAVVARIPLGSCTRISYRPSASPKKR
jgi:hypothetical protein